MRCIRNALKAFKECFYLHQGFSLLDTAITLIIMGIILGMTLPVVSHVQYKLRYRTSQKNIEKVLHAIACYVIDHHDLPNACCDFEDGTAQALQGEPTLKEAVGYVPYRTLGLPCTYARDGWGHPLRYVRALREKIMGPAYASLSISKIFEHQLVSINVKDAKGKSVFYPINEEDHNSIAIVLIAFNEGHQPAGEWEQQNYSGHLHFVAAPYSTHSQQPFRHYIKWVTNYQLITAYGFLSQIKDANDLSLLEKEKPSFQASTPSSKISKASEEEDNRSDGSNSNSFIEKDKGEGKPDYREPAMREDF